MSVEAVLVRGNIGFKRIWISDILGNGKYDSNERILQSVLRRTL